MHRVRAALDFLKRKPGSGVKKDPKHEHWLIGDLLAARALDAATGFFEGREVLRLHRKKERNPKLVHRKKATTLSVKGCLQCEVCDFDFQVKYGNLGRGFAECHHRTPLSQLTQATLTTLSDLAIVCANCHRMLHRVNGMSVEDLKRSIQSQAGTLSK
jgi:5-methylcytosine-specific restriction protein A